MSINVVLITGATGVVGSAVVPGFLEDPDTEVRLLMRAESDQHLQQRLRDLVEFWRPEFDVDEQVMGRIKPLRGDVSEPMLGLAEDEYGALCSDLTHIVHSAANVKMNMSVGEARKISVDSALGIVTLAEACQANGRFRKLEYVSTIGVAGRMIGLVPESPLRNDREFHNTYESSKAEAESLVLEKMEMGLPATIHRPSMVVGDSKTGKIMHFQVFYHLCTFLSGRPTRGLLPSLKGACLDTVPADYVASAILCSSRRDEMTGKILHLCSGPKLAVRLESLRCTVASVYSDYETLPRTATIPTPLFQFTVFLLERLAGAKGRRALGALKLLMDYLAESKVQFFSNDETQKLLGRAGLTVPPAEAYLENVLRYYLDSRTST